MAGTQQSPTIQGIFNTGNFVDQQQKLSFSAMIARMMPNGDAPLFALTSMLSSSVAAQVEHGFWAKTMIFPSFALAVTLATGDTTATVVTTANLLPGQIHRLESSGENVLITEVLSPTEIRITRQVGNVVPVEVDPSTDVPAAHLVGNAYEESSIRPQPLAINPIRITNLTQIFRNTWAISGTAAATEVIAGDTNIAENRQDCAAFHAAAIESALIFGQKSQGFRNGQPFRTMDGLVSVISNMDYYPPSYSVPNVHQADTVDGTNFTQLEAMLNPVFDQKTDGKSSNERVIFVGGTSRTTINNIGRKSGYYQLHEGQTSFGLAFSSFKTSRGTFRLIEHPLFNSNPYWKSNALVVDLAGFKLAYLKDRKTSNKEFNTAGQPAVDNGIDAVGGSLLTEVTTEIHNPPANAIIYNLSLAAGEPLLTQEVS